MQLSNNVYQLNEFPSQIARFGKAFHNNIPAVFALWLFIALILLTLFSNWLIPFEPEFYSGEVLMPPSWNGKGQVTYFLGTDGFGRDILSRLILGANINFGYALIIAFSAGIIGVLIGLIASIFDGVISRTFNHLLDAALAIPSLLVAIIFVAFNGNDGMHVFFALWLALLPKFIRTTYSAVTDEMNKEYILSSRLDGANNVYLMYHAILPNISANLINTLTKGISITILDIAALGFLGLAEYSSAPEWGYMIKESMDYLVVAPWTIILPCCVITFAVLITNLLGDGISQAINEGTN